MMLVEFMKPGVQELAQRWLSALLVVPGPERQAVVEAVEAQIVKEYGSGASGIESRVVSRTSHSAG
jgi:hypothetical protein